jgi:hypothetical protein
VAGPGSMNSFDRWIAFSDEWVSKTIGNQWIFKMFTESLDGKNAFLLSAKSHF